MASGSGVDSAIRLLVQKTAHLHYSRQPASVKASIREGFFGLDESQDGRISLKEFLQVMHEDDGDHQDTDIDGRQQLAGKLFRFLDSDGSGYLEFDEYITLHYLLDSGLQTCDSCGSPVMVLGYTCKSCLQEGSDTFDLCHACYASRRYSHASCPDSAILDNATVYTLLLSNDAHRRSTVQCSCCGDFHCKDMESILVADQKHIAPSQASPQEFVCEWCSCWFCNNCGNFFPGASSSSAPNKWLRTNICCSRCRAHGTKTDLTSVFKALQSNDSSHKCETCAIKIKKGLLWVSWKDPITSRIPMDALQLR